MGELRSFRVPFAAAESEFTEKRSRFIGHIWPVETEEQAQAYIRTMKKRYYDARHNCWCYLVGESVVRYSDDGEPQGTAGQPMLNVFQRENVTNVCCVVTRYFGGIPARRGRPDARLLQGRARRAGRGGRVVDGPLDAAADPAYLPAFRAGEARARGGGGADGRHGIRRGRHDHGVAPAGAGGAALRAIDGALRRRDRPRRAR